MFFNLLSYPLMITGHDFLKQIYTYNVEFFLFFFMAFKAFFIFFYFFIF